MLAERVRAGKLPPLKERLPERPMPVPVVEELGEYGGAWRTFHIGVGLETWRIINNYTPLIRWNSQVTELSPGAGRKLGIFQRGTQHRLSSAQGVRWSTVCRSPRAIF